MIRFLIIITAVSFPAKADKLLRVSDWANDSPVICNGRLTLTTGTSITTGSVTAAGTVFFTPHHGDRISLYSRTNWQLFSFSEKSVAVPSTTSTPFDIFAYNNSGTVALETTDWTNDTTRATSLTKQDGVYVKTGALTRRYLGTGRTTTVSGQTEDSPSKRLLWNLYNQVIRPIYPTEALSSWSYSGGWRVGAGNANNKVEVLYGLAETYLHLDLYGHVTGTAVMDAGIGICEDCAATATVNPGWYTHTSVVANGRAPMIASVRKFPTIGYHYYNWTEYASQLTTFHGSYNSEYGQISGFVTQ